MMNGNLNTRNERSINLILDKSKHLYTKNKFEEIIVLLKDAISNGHFDHRILSGLAVAYENTNKIELAIQYYTKALDEKADYIPALQYRGISYLKEEEFFLAIEDFKKIYDIDPNFYEAINNLALCYAETNQAKESIEIFEEILEKFPDKTTSIVNYAFLLSEIGDFQKAKEMHSLAIKKSKETLAFQQLCEMGEIKYNDAIVEEMLQYWLDPDNDKRVNSDIINIYFGLGAVYFNVGSYEESAKYYNLGNKFKRSEMDWSLPHYENKNNIQGSYQNIFEKIKIRNNKKIIFIVGLPRSGTTLLEQMLDRHDRISGLGEKNFIALGLSEFKKNKSNTYSVDRDSKILSASNELKDISESIEKKYTDIANQNKDSDYVFVDKNPYNFQHIGFIKSILPNSKIININRNKNDVLTSIYFSSFTGLHNYAYNQKELNEYYYFYLKTMNFWKEKFQKEIFEINYEDLVADPEEKLKLIFEFIEMKYDRKCLNPDKNKRIIKTRSKFQIREGVNKKGINKYKGFEDYLSSLYR